MLQGGLIDKNWLLLDSSSTMSCICDKELVENITACKDTEVTRVYTNGGHVDYTRKANLQILLNIYDVGLWTLIIFLYL